MTMWVNLGNKHENKMHLYLSSERSVQTRLSANHFEQIYRIAMGVILCNLCNFATLASDNGFCYSVSHTD